MSSVLVSERDFTRQVREVAQLFGYLRYHTWLAKHSPAGFPDEVLCRPPRLVFAELKAERGKLSQPQEDWLEWLARCGVETYVWRPHMLEEIIKCLRPRMRPINGPGAWERLAA